MKSKITAALAVSVLLVVLGVATSFWSLNQMKEADAARKHTQVVIHMANNLLSALKDAETGQLGYLLTGDEDFLGAYLNTRYRSRFVSPYDLCRNRHHVFELLLDCAAGFAQFVFVLQAHPELHGSAEHLG